MTPPRRSSPRSPRSSGLPTYETTRRFSRDLKGLTGEQRAAFLSTIEAFVADLESGAFRASLRVKGVTGAPGVFEMTFAPDGRTTFQYGPEHRPGHAHIIWRRVGTHAVFSRP